MARGHGATRAPRAVRLRTCGCAQTCADRVVEARRRAQRRERRDEHAEEPLFARARARRATVGRPSRSSRTVDVEPFVVVDVQQPPDRAQQRALRGSVGRRRQTSLATHLRPAVIAGVDVVEIEAAALEVLAETDLAERAKLAAPLAPRARNGVADAAEHDLLRHCVEVEAAAGRQERESRCAPAARRRRASRRATRGSRRSKRNSFRCVPTKSRTVQALFPTALRSPRPSCWRKSVGLSVGRSRRSVSTLGTSMPSLKRSTVKTTRTFPSERSRSAPAPLVWTARRRERDGRKTELREALRHEASVADADAVAERSHA